MEIVVYLFASVGILYWMRDFVFWLLYRRRNWGLFLEVSLSEYSEGEFVELLGILCGLRDGVLGKRLVRGISLIGDRDSALRELRALQLANAYGIPVKRSPRRRFARTALRPPEPKKGPPLP